MAAVGVNEKFTLNIVELQNVITSAGGTTPIATLTTQMAQLQEMINYNDKQIKANTLSAFSDGLITVTDSMEFATGTTLSLGGTAFGGGAATSTTTNFTAVPTVGFVSSFTNYFSTTGATDTAISFQVGSPAVQPIQMLGGGGIRLPVAGTPGIGKYLTCMDALGTAEWQTPAMPSDARLKGGVEPIRDSWEILAGIRGVRFHWIGSGEADVGLLAQEVRPVLPEAVLGREEDGVERPLLVAYQKLVPVLVEAVKSLHARVRDLELVAAPHPALSPP
jgi:hypothetical protein